MHNIYYNLTGDVGDDPQGCLICHPPYLNPGICNMCGCSYYLYYNYVHWSGINLINIRVCRECDFSYFNKHEKHSLYRPRLVKKILLYFFNNHDPMNILNRCSSG